ncbi:MAG: DUF6701 domain-containing protein, partial [Thiohalospira sp.]
MTHRLPSRNPCGRRLVSLLGGLAMAGFAFAVNANGGAPADTCSSYIGDATLNEIHDLGDDQWVEVRLLDEDIEPDTWEDWTVVTSTGPGAGGEDSYDLGDATANESWLKLDVDKQALDLNGETEVALLDSNGEYIDYLSINGADSNEPRNCDDFLYDTDAVSDSQYKSVMRLPDGVGDWMSPSSPGAGGGTTPGGSNDGGGGTQTVDASSREYEGDDAALYTRIVGNEFDLTVRYRADEPEPQEVTLDLVEDDGDGGCGQILSADWGSSSDFDDHEDGGYEATLSDLIHDEAVRRARVRIELVVESGVGNPGGWCNWFPWWPGCDGSGNDDSQAGTLEYCSSDAFSIRPKELSLNAISASEEALTRDDWSGYAPTTCSDEACQAAGADFTLGIEALPTGQGFDSDIQLRAEGHPQAPDWMVPGTISPTTLTFDGTADEASATDAAYDEVGLVSVDAHDEGDFAAIDRNQDHCVAGEADNTINADGLVGCRTALPEPEPLGRFIPDHFAVVEAEVTNRMELDCPVDDGFTYLGEALGASVTLEARSVAEAATENYREGYASLPALDWSMVAPEAEDGHLDGRLEIVRDTSGWGQGQASFSPEVTVVRADEADGPFTADVAFIATDADGVALRDATLDVDRDGDDVDDYRSAGGTNLRHGRLTMASAHGAEFAEVALPLRAEYWAGDDDGWVLSGDDCTPLEDGGGGSRFRYRSASAGDEFRAWEDEPDLGALTATVTPTASLDGGE